MRSTTRRCITRAALALLLALVGMLGAAPGPQPAHAKEPPRQIIGTWRISDASGGLGEEMGIMRIGPRGQFFLALTGRVTGSATPASMPQDEAARLYRGTVIVEGYCHPVLKAGSNDELALACDVVVEHSNVAAMVRKEFRLDFTITEDNKDGSWFMASRSGPDAPIALNRRWILLENQ